uniref:uncharacterized protein LOC122608128 isoform X2 n=1 Tax=Erigeron canadensis TaxID=72917 RepID=UPI001CB96D11|nr:uncharacterized protein LOC122608128 isoform X2 [Erigeron canadensis]
MSSIKEFQHLKIPLQDLIAATNNFGDTHRIGQGGFGKVYKGELVLPDGLTVVAVKRLDRAFGQGDAEFWKEVMLLTRYKHEHLVSLLGFCNEGSENILVYEYLTNRSLDLYLSGNDLSWNQRLRICIGAAHGLQFLHHPAEGSQQRVLHRDIKSANILLDQDWKPKIADFGLSKFGPANQQYTYLFSNAVGTMGYCDPLYMQTGYLTKESDIYSFGVVLFEVLCGRLCVQNYEDVRRFLAILARKCYEEKKLDTIIHMSLKEEISPPCLERFSTIAYQCLQTDRTERPSIAKIVKELEIALQYQVEYDFEKEKKLKQHVVIDYNSDEYWESKLPRDLEVIVKRFKIPHAIYAVKKDLFAHLQKGLLCDEGNKFFWINDYGKKCVLLSPRSFLNHDLTTWVFQRDYLRFSRVAEYSYGALYDIKCQIKTSMLSLGTMYAASLMFKYRGKPRRDQLAFKIMSIKWKMDELSVQSMHYAEQLSDNWYKIEMWNFINHGPDADFDIVLEKLSFLHHPMKSDLLIQGIDIQPLEMDVRDEETEGFRSLSMTYEGDIDIDKNTDLIMTYNGDIDTDVDTNDMYWEKKLPDDYQRYIEISDKPLDYTTTKELYLRFCEGFLCDNGRLFLSLCKSTRGIRAMLAYLEDYDYWEPDYMRSHEDGGKSETPHFRRLSFSERRHMFSPHHNYACYLVFKFPEKPTQTEDILLFSAECMLELISQGTMYACMSFSATNIPIIKPKSDYRLHDSSNIPADRGRGMIKGRTEHYVYSRIEERKDGWMEVMLCKLLCHLEDPRFLSVKLRDHEYHTVRTLPVKGIEFRPCNV